MNNPAINQTLIELEESLSKIESARTQVNDVTQKSEQIINSFNKVLKSIDSIHDGLGIDKESIKANLDVSFKNFEDELSLLLKKSELSIEEVNNVFISQKVKFKEVLEINIKNLEHEFTKVGSNIEEKTNVVKNELSSLSSEFNTGINKINSNLNNFDIKLIEAEKRIQELNFTNEFKSLSSQLESQRRILELNLNNSLQEVLKQIKAKQNLNIVIMGICTVILIGFIIVF